MNTTLLERPTLRPITGHPDNLTAALTLWADDRSVIPIKPGTKEPRIRWKNGKTNYSKVRPTLAEVTEWWTAHPGDGIAVVCGAVSGLVLIDIDPQHDGEPDEWARRLPSTRRTLSGRGTGGGHHWLAYPPEGIKTTIGAWPGVDILS